MKRDKDNRYEQDEYIIDLFMEQKKGETHALKTDGQSLFSFGTRIAEHIPDDYGRAATLVYDYTYGGGAYITQTVSNHVRLTKKRVPRPNWVSVETAREHGLVPETLPEVKRRGKNSSQTR